MNPPGSDLVVTFLEWIINYLNHRYLTGSGERCNVFLRIVDLFDGKAETIEKALLQFCDVAGIEMRKVMGFGSDGAAVMIGRVSGISTRLRVHNSVMISCSSRIWVHSVPTEIQERHPQSLPLLSRQFRPYEWAACNTRSSWRS